MQRKEDPSVRRAIGRKARKHAVIIARIALRAIPRDARDVEGPEYRAERAATRERAPRDESRLSIGERR
jgi:hypothetical protein